MKGEGHLCFVCNNTQRYKNGPCPLCKDTWSTNPLVDPSELSAMIDSAAVVFGDPLRFTGMERGWDLESTDTPAPIIEAESWANKISIVKTEREEAITVAAEMAKIQAKLANIGKRLEDTQLTEVRDSIAIIAKVAEFVRKAYVNTEKVVESLETDLENLRAVK